MEPRRAAVPTRSFRVGVSNRARVDLPTRRRPGPSDPGRNLLGACESWGSQKAADDAFRSATVDSHIIPQARKALDEPGYRIVTTDAETIATRTDKWDRSCPDPSWVQNAPNTSESRGR